MLLITQLFEVDNCQSILRDDFTNNKRKWEITNKEAREAFIKDGSYWMENKSNAGWNYYKIKSPIKIRYLKYQCQGKLDCSSARLLPNWPFHRSLAAAFTLHACIRPFHVT